MRPLTLAGLLLLLLGGYVVVRGLSYTTSRSVLKVGDFQATVEEKRGIPPWAGALAVAAGIALVVAGSRRPG